MRSKKGKRRTQKQNLGFWRGLFTASCVTQYNCLFVLYCRAYVRFVISHAECVSNVIIHLRELQAAQFRLNLLLWDKQHQISCGDNCNIQNFLFNSDNSKPLQKKSNTLISNHLSTIFNANFIDVAELWPTLIITLT